MIPLFIKHRFLFILDIEGISSREPEMTKFGYVTPPYHPCEAFLCGLLAERPGWRYLYDYEIKSGSGLKRNLSPQK